MRLTIDRNVWARGGGKINLLLDSTRGRRKQCCVGIYLTALGVPDKLIRSCGGPGSNRNIRTAMPDSAKWLLSSSWNSDEALDLFHANDDDVEERESAIAAIFARHGVEVEFVG